MIVKELTRKGNEGQLFRYLFRYMDDQKKQNNDHVVVTHNVFGNTVNEYIQSFKENEQLRVHKRKNNVRIRHTILSFSPKDKEHISKDILIKTANKFISLRGKDNLYVIIAHTEDVNHLHLHCAVSSTNLFGMSSRMSFQEFNDLKHELSDYIRQEFPQIKYSFPKHGRKRKEREKENIIAKRDSQKQSLQQCLDTLFTTSKSTEHFLEQIKEQGHEPYYRNGRLQGVLHYGDQKHRFSTLGFDKDKLTELDTREALQELDDIRNHNEQERQLETDNPELEELQHIRDNSTDDHEREPEPAHANEEPEDEEKE